MIRVDPTNLVTVCIGNITNNAGESIPHQHLTHMMMAENNVLSPILPIGLQSIRFGHVLPEPCPYALNLLPQSASAHVPQLSNAGNISSEPCPEPLASDAFVSNAPATTSSITNQNVSVQAGNDPEIHRAK